MVGNSLEDNSIDWFRERSKRNSHFSPSSLLDVRAQVERTEDITPVSQLEVDRLVGAPASVQSELKSSVDSVVDALVVAVQEDTVVEFGAVSVRIEFDSSSAVSV